MERLAADCERLQRCLVGTERGYQPELHLLGAFRCCAARWPLQATRQCLNL